MRIWAFPSFYPHDYPGMRWTGIFAHRQYKALIELGATLKVVQPVMWHPRSPFQKLNSNWKEVSRFAYPLSRVYDGIEVHHPRIPNMKPGRIFRTPYAQKYEDTIVEFFTKGGVAFDAAKDVFLAQWLPDAAMVVKAGRRLGVRTAVMAVGDDVLILPQANAARMQIFKETLRDADIRLAVAKYLGDEANKLLDTPVPFTVIRRGVNHDFFKPVSADEKVAIRKEYGLPQDKIVILMIGAAIERKGWLDMLDALAMLKKETDGFVLAAVYAGHEEVNLTAEAAKRGLAEHFIKLGEVEPRLMARVHNAADIFCLPSHSEGIANSVVEAMATGVPAVTTAICGHPELITSGKNGIMVAAHEPARLKDVLAELVASGELRAAIGSNARNFIVNEWGNYALNAAKLLDILGS